MKLFIAFCLLGLAIGASVPASSSKRSNASTYLTQPDAVATVASAPHTVSVQRNGNHVCGGTIIDKSWVLTSAECVAGLNAALVKVRYNTLHHNFGGTQAQVQEIFIHEQFNSATIENNIALLRLSGTGIDLDNTPNQAAQIPCGLTIHYGAFVKVTGWGLRTSDSGSLSSDLNEVVLPMMELDCAKYYASIGLTVDDKSFCAGDIENGGKGICKGDEGGPAIRVGYKTVHGLASMHVGCGQPRYVSVFTRVAQYASWIKAHTGIECYDDK